MTIFPSSFTSIKLTFFIYRNHIFQSQTKKKRRKMTAPTSHHHHHKFMRLAVEEGISGVECGDGGPFGAVVVNYEGDIVAKGHNMVFCSNDPTAHAEITAIRVASATLGTFDLSGCHLYTSCFPCPMCMGASLWARLDTVFYATSPKDAASVGFDDQNFHDFVRAPNANGLKLLQHMPIEGCMEPFRKWAEKEDKRQY